jgi:hypothetical protein
MAKYPLTKSDEKRDIVNTLDADHILLCANGDDAGFFVISHTFGPVAAVWADHEEDALDEAADADLLKALAIDADHAEELIDEKGYEEFARLGNASDPYDLNDAHIRRIPWKDIPAETQDALLLAIDEGFDSLEDLDDLEEEEDDEDMSDGEYGDAEDEPDRVD